MGYETIFLFFWCITGTFLVFTFVIMGQKAISIFPDVKSVKVVYKKNNISGYSNTSLITKAGGTRKALNIIVTDNEVWLKPPLFLAGIAQFYDLVHKIPLKNIVHVEREKRKVTLDFKISQNTNKQIVLYLSKPDDFINAISKKTC